MPLTCSTCGEQRESAFSRRMLRRKGSRRCRTCVAAAEATEQAEAVYRRQQGRVVGHEAAADQSISLLLCAMCGQRQLPSAFSRSQLQQKGDGRRCLACVAAPVHHHLRQALKETRLLVNGDSDDAAKLVADTARAPCCEPNLAVEILRLGKVKRLRRIFLRLCAEKGCDEPPVLAFDRWLARAKLAEQLARSTMGGPSAVRAARVTSHTECDMVEPLLPTTAGGQAGLVSDLQRNGKLSATAADEVASELLASSLRATRKLSSGSFAVGDGHAQKAQITWRGDVARLSRHGITKPFIEISAEHMQKLAALHACFGTRRATVNNPDPAQEQDRLLLDGAGGSISCGGASNAGGVKGVTIADFHTRSLCMLLRYEALGAKGYQAAVDPATFLLLRSKLGVSAECFASPLNATLSTYCSLFADVDGFFGSLGSFFDFSPSEGSFEANPPFVPELMSAAVEHANELLGLAESRGSPLSFAFVVPTWEPLHFHRTLLKSRWRSAEPLFLSASAHGFVDGAQQSKSHDERLRVSSFGTTFAVLQTSEGSRRWPVTPVLLDELRVSFAAALPTVEAAEARKQRGGGDAVSQLLRRRERDACVGGTVVGTQSAGQQIPSSLSKFDSDLLTKQHGIQSKCFASSKRHQVAPREGRPSGKRVKLQA
mmetsp:Transcript_76517/g.127537  ORF Transcript_76517/g.127537 Transcript_76517/m.127537 type:complete len:657 (-) Transcript_76517:181-2151(-)